MLAQDVAEVSDEFSDLRPNARPAPYGSAPGAELLQEPQLLRSRNLTRDEEFFVDRAYQEPMESASRLEETAKWLALGVAATAGMFLTVVPISSISARGWSLLWLVPSSMWLISLITLVFVLSPQQYSVLYNSPDGLKRAILAARRRRFRLLLCGTISYFVAVCVSFALIM